MKTQKVRVFRCFPEGRAGRPERPAVQRQPAQEDAGPAFRKKSPSAKVPVRVKLKGLIIGKRSAEERFFGCASGRTRL